MMINKRLQQLLVSSPLFDPVWYQQRFPDVSKMGISADMHYLLIGSKLQRDPGPDFSCQQYLQEHPQVKGNAFLHYLFASQGVPHPAVTTTVLSATSIASALNLQEKSAGQWQSLSNDPQFHFSLPPSGLAAGYYLLELQLNATAVTMTSNSKLYLNYGSGFTEEDSLIFSVPLNNACARVIYLRDKVKAVRFDPLEVMMDFQLATFSMGSLDAAVLSDYLAHYLASKQINIVQNQPTLAELYQLYDDDIGRQPGSISYQQWIEQKESPSLPSSAEVQQQLNSWPILPLFSVVMPTYNTEAKFLVACIESVIQQSYPHWEFCIADDCSTKPHVAEILAEYAAKDARIKVVIRQQNGHISLATNSAIALATGDFIVLLDHDDLLAKDALFFMAQAVNQQPNGQIFYSDEDKIDLKGRRSDPHFKSDWNPDLFFSQNFVSHLGVYKRSLISLIGGFRTGVEGSQDQDLLLRCLPHVRHEDIHHIPRILYHWRMLEGSTALASGEKSYTTVAGIKALNDYFAAQGPVGVKVEAGQVANTYRVHWPIPASAPKVSLLIPTRDRRNLLEVAVRSILEKTTYANYEVVILDNGSVEADTLAFFAEITQQDPRVKVLRYDYPFNYSAINNFGVAATTGELVGLINNDIEVINPEWLTEMVSHAIRPEVGCVGAKLYYGNELIQHAGVILGIGGVANHSHKMFPRSAFGYFARLVCPQNLSAVTAAVLVVRRDIYQQVGGLNELDLTVAFNDVDFCLKVRQAGYRNLWTPYAELYHHESISRGAEDTPEKQARFAKEVAYMNKTWGEQLITDPYYNPNLSKTKDDFSLAL